MLQQRLGEGFVSALGALRDALSSGGKILVLGIGKCSHIGDKIAATLTSTGSPAIALNSMNALHGDLGIIKDGDAVLCLSYSGETEEMLNLLPALRRFDLNIIAITGNPKSTLARYSDVVIDVAVQKEACPLKLAPTSSTTAMLVLGDALAMVLLELAGFQPEDFARFHPGGDLGRRLLTKTRDIMRPIDQIALISAGTSVPDALDAMARCRGGAAVVTDQHGKLAGIFTHGDFARAFREHDAKINHLTVEQLMTRDPVSISADQLAVEVLGVLKTHRINDLVVLDQATDSVVGIVDVQDLSRQGLL